MKKYQAVLWVFLGLLVTVRAAELPPGLRDFDAFVARVQQEFDVPGVAVAIVKDGAAATQAEAGDAVLIVLNQTPFYAESGGQVGDTGRLTGDGAVIDVENTSKHVGRIHALHGRVRSGCVGGQNRHLVAAGAAPRRPHVEQCRAPGQGCAQVDPARFTQARDDDAGEGTRGWWRARRRGRSG